MYWGLDWLLGLPLFVLVVVFHVCMLALMERALFRSGGARSLGYRIAAVAALALCAAALHGVEAAAWAGLYLATHALPDPGAAMLYSLSAITAYGHSAIFLEDRWRLVGAIEAMNGLILFGLTTAFLFGAIDQVRRKSQG